LAAASAAWDCTVARKPELLVPGRESEVKRKFSAVRQRGSVDRRPTACELLSLFVGTRKRRGRTGRGPTGATRQRWSA